MKRSSVAIMVVGLSLMLFGCGNDKVSVNDSNKIVIWTSGEDFKNDFYLQSLKKKFPNYEFVMEYMNSSSIAAKVIAEGKNSTCDIICSEEYGYLDKCGDKLAVLDKFDFKPFLDDIVPASHRYTPEVKNGGCIIVNNDVLKRKGIAKPSKYGDLLDKQYKGLVAMPNPASSGTGYMFLRQLTNEWGEVRAFDYFAKLTPNILQYTSSGSGPVKALVQGEIAVGLGMTSQAVVERRQGVNLDILFFPEGSPFGMYGNAILAHKANRKCVQEAFNYIAMDLCKQVNQKFFPDQIFKDYAPSIEGFPKNIKYGNMKNDTRAEKERLLKQWKF